MMNVATAMLREKGIKIDEDGDAMFQLLPSVSVSNAP
jgi:hypothetical protein